MILALDPRIPRVWRTPQSLQFGVDAPVLVLDGVTAAEERLLAALGDGVTPHGYAMVARRVGAPDAGVALLARVRPVLVEAAEREAAPSPVVVVDGAGPTAACLSWLLSESGAEVLAAPALPAAECADAAVIVASYAVGPRRHARWLRRDIPHLPIVFGDGGVTVGPLVQPGRGPCLRCLDLHRTDADPAWPALATQLYTRATPGETAVLATAAAARAATVVLAEVGACGGAAVSPAAAFDAGEPGPASRTSARLAAGGTEWVSRAWEPHPGCGCLGPPP